MADSVAYQHTDGNRNYDGSNLVYGVIEKERGSFHTASFFYSIYIIGIEVTLVFDAQLFIIFACSLAGGICADDFIVEMGEAWLYPTLCMDDVVERVAQHRSADVLGIGCIVITVALDLYLGIEVLELQIEEVAPIASVAGLVPVTSEDAALSGRRCHVVDDFAYRIVLAENGGACQILQFEGSGIIGNALALGTLTGLVVKGRGHSLVACSHLFGKRLCGRTIDLRPT